LQTKTSLLLVTFFKFKEFLIMNKNTKILQAHFRAARKSQQTQIILQVPASGYHNDAKGRWRPCTFDVAGKPNGDGVISQSSDRRNMRQRVLYNANGNGGTDSLTVHEASIKGLSVQHPNHAYMARDESKRFSGYFQPRA
jgi:hypothetical protein